MRIDIWLVENGLAPSRQKAQELIATGRVVFTASDGQTKQIKKPSTFVDDQTSSKIRVEASLGPEFVSRGGLKLFGAVQKIAASLVATAQLGIRSAETFFENTSVLDCGISTGGFADCALQLGAKRVVGVDVGHGQLAPKLKSDSRVTLFEGINARDFARGDDPKIEGIRAEIFRANDGVKFDFVVVDVSFISLKIILPGVVSFLSDSGWLIALVKPQFEVGREGIGRNGIVKDAKLYPPVESSLRDVCASLGLRVESYFDSPILGSDGNREFFIHAQFPQSDVRLVDRGPGFGLPGSKDPRGSQ